MSLGTTNFGVLAHYLHPLRHDLVLRFGLGFGLSMLMGLIWEFADGVAVTADPLDLALPAPGLTGWPILFTQHRMSLGLQFAL